MGENLPAALDADGDEAMGHLDVSARTCTANHKEREPQNETANPGLLRDSPIVTGVGEPHGLLGDSPIVTAAGEPPAGHKLEETDEALSPAMDPHGETVEVLIISSREVISDEHAVAEIYSPPRVVPVAQKHGLAGGRSLDLQTTDSEGRPWNFDGPDTRRRARQLHDQTKPKLLVASP